MSFFIRNNKRNKNPIKSDSKRKKFDKRENSETKITANKKHKNVLNEDIVSDSDDEEFNDRRRQKANDEELSEYEETETVQEKKIRLAKKYLDEIEKQERERNDVDVVDKTLISGRLRDDILEESGRLHKAVADNYIGFKHDSIRCLKNGHRLSITCIVVSPNSKFVFSASKDCSIVKWDFDSGKRIKTIPGGKKGSEETHVGHTAIILSLSISSDSKFLVSGCYNKLIHVWNPDTLERIHTFKGHRGAVSGLAFRKGSHQLFSSSFDRSIKVWNLDEMSYVETLFGHQDPIMAIDSLIRERAITAGGRDATVRIWKIVEESQLVFLGNKSSIDCVKLIDEQHFVSAEDNGSISLWRVSKKKPLTSYPNAHGVGSSESNWITSLAVLRNTDLIASGSQDGSIRLWKCSQNFIKLEPVINIPIVGFVNSLEFSNNGEYLVAGIGQEHRLGRWWRIKEAKNSILIIPLLQKKC